VNFKFGLKDWLKPEKWFEGEDKKAEQFSLALGMALFLVSIFSLFRGNPIRAEKLSIIAGLIVALGMVSPRILVPLEKIARGIFLGFAWLNTQLLLILVFYLVFTPLGLLLRLFGKKLLNTKFRGDEESYFEFRKEEYDPKRDELQF